MKNSLTLKSNNSLLCYIGILILVIGVGLNVKMYVNEEWPTIIFILICCVGLIQIILSFVLRTMKVGWQLFWALIPFVIGWVYFAV